MEDSPSNIPTTAKFARYCFLTVASSAAAERVLSTLKNGLSLVQLNKCIEEYSEIATMLQYSSVEVCSDVVSEKISSVTTVDGRFYVYKYSRFTHTFLPFFHLPEHASK